MKTKTTRPRDKEIEVAEEERQGYSHIIWYNMLHVSLTKYIMYIYVYLISKRYNVADVMLNQAYH